MQRYLRAKEEGRDLLVGTVRRRSGDVRHGQSAFSAHRSAFHVFIFQRDDAHHARPIGHKLGSRLLSPEERQLERLIALNLASGVGVHLIFGDPEIAQAHLARLEGY